MITPAYSHASLVADPFAGREVAVFNQLATILATQTVDQIEEKLIENEPVECPVIHRFGPGVYIREVTLPAGTIAIGHLHRTAHINIILKGRVTVMNDNGTTTEIEAPYVYTSQPGRKVVFAQSEVVWQNIFATTETDVQVLEEMLLDKSDVSIDDTEQRMQLEQMNHDDDHADYLLAIAEYGLTPAQAWDISSNKSDQITMPLGSYKYMQSDSPIHGRGMFASASIAAGEVIAPARVGNNRTPAGRYTNHSVRPNAIMVQRSNGDIDLVATKNIHGCLGGRPGQEITIDYRQAFGLSSNRS